MNASMHESVVRWDRCLDGWMNEKRDVWGGRGGGEVDKEVAKGWKNSRSNRNK